MLFYYFCFIQYELMFTGNRKESEKYTTYYKYEIILILFSEIIYEEHLFICIKYFDYFVVLMMRINHILVCFTVRIDICNAY